MKKYLVAYGNPDEGFTLYCGHRFQRKPMTKEQATETIQKLLSNSDHGKAYILEVKQVGRLVAPVSFSLFESK